LKRFRRWVVGIALGMTTLCVACSFFVDRTLAYGLLMGGLAGTLGFWLAVRQAGQMAMPGGRLRLGPWFALRLLIYGLVLYQGYQLDPVHWYGFAGAAFGLLIARVAVSIVAITGWDLKQPVG